MGVYIRDMEMPENCGECVYRHLSLTGSAFCPLAREDIPFVQLFRTGEKGRLDNCPLVDVPEPHSKKWKRRNWRKSLKRFFTKS